MPVADDFVDAVGMLFIGVALIGLDTRFDSDLMGDCSSNASEPAKRLVTALFGTLSPVCEAPLRIVVNDVTMLRKFSNSSLDNMRSRWPLSLGLTVRIGIWWCCCCCDSDDDSAAVVGDGTFIAYA